MIPTSASPVATVVITAHNRRELALKAVELAKAQSVPVEIIVCDDASSDGLGDALAAAHPDVRFLRSDTSHGPCFQRNQGIAEARGEIVFPIDDDSLLVSTKTVEQTLPEFDDPRVGLVAMPFRNILRSDHVWQRRRSLSPEAAVNFAACAHALRKRAWSDIGGYAEDYFYMFEESDIALRLISRGWRVIAGAADPIHHMQPPSRRSYKADYYGRRNQVLFFARYCPAGQLPLRLAMAVANGLIVGVTRRCLKASLDGLAAGFVAGWRTRDRRAPVRPREMSAFMACRRAESMPLAEFERALAR